MLNGKGKITYANYSFSGTFIDDKKHGKFTVIDGTTQTTKYYFNDEEISKLSYFIKKMFGKYKNK